MSESDKHRPLLFDYFRGSADVLLSEYERSSGQQACNNMGKNREYFCKEWLSKALPKKLVVASGEICDAAGHGTGQLDLIITRDDCPLLPIGLVHTYLAEGVLAVIEVKSNLTNAKLKEAAGTLNKVMALQVESPPVRLGSRLKIWRPLRIVFAYEGATWGTIIDAIVTNKWLDLFDIVSIVGCGILLRNDVLLHWEGEPLGLFSGRAAALGYLYYYLVSFGSELQAGGIDLQPYFWPHESWVSDD